MLPRSHNIIRTTHLCSRFHTSRLSLNQPKASIKLIAEIRKITDNQTSFSKAKEALLATQNDLEAALAWLEKDNVISGAKKAAKVAGRVASDGLIGIAVLSDGSASAKRKGSSGVRAAMIEVNCETDFVARNDIFAKLVADIAHTAAYFAEAPSPSSQQLINPGIIQPFSIGALSAAPLLSSPSSSSVAPLDPSRTISLAVQETTAKIGEKISLRRACSFVGPALPPSSNLALRIGTYIHQSSTTQPQTGKIGALVALALKSNHLPDFGTKGGDNEVNLIGRALARQVVGLNAERIGKSSASEGDPASTALYAQPFMMRPGGGTELSVRTALDEWAQDKGLASTDAEGGIEVLEFVKWSAGEGIDKAETEGGFAEEVRRLSA